MQTTPPPITFDPAARGPLQGVRILDLSRLVAGNMLSLQLADFGADVIKVEAPGGDPLRNWRNGGHELHWKVYARNKRSIVLNLHHDKARMALVRLAAAGTRGFFVSPERKRAKARIAPACSGFAPAPPTQGREPDHVIAVPLQIAACCDTVE